MSRHTIMHHVLPASVLAALAVTPGLAQAPDARQEQRPQQQRYEHHFGRESQPSAPNPPPNTADRTFLSRATQSGVAEVELAHLAEQRAASPAVREFAKRMAAEHEETNRALQALAESAGAGANGMAPESREVRDGLSRLSGAEFDIEYLRQQVQAHQRMATLLQYQIGSGSDPQVRRVATDALPKVFSHLAAARKLLDETSTQNPQAAGVPPRAVSGMPTLQTPRASGN